MARIPNSIRLFPHSDDEFSHVEDLAEFLETVLAERGGVYRVRKASRYSGLRDGDLVIFHKNRRFVGEARIKNKLTRYTRSQGPYEGKITFDRKSIRVYAPSFDQVEELTGLEVTNQAIQQISLEDYQAILRLR